MVISVLDHGYIDIHIHSINEKGRSFGILNELLKAECDYVLDAKETLLDKVFYVSCLRM